jgi:DNAJ protein RME-8 N-terminal
MHTCTRDNASQMYRHMYWLHMHVLYLVFCHRLGFHLRVGGAGGVKGNWKAFWSNLERDHCHAGLIWNERTRTELREALQVIRLLL